MKRASETIVFLTLLCASLHGGTIATFKTTLGTMEVELYDETRPITVTNFVTYVQNRKYDGLFLQRWEPDFVIQAGGWKVLTNIQGEKSVDVVSPYANITNEAGAGPVFYENDYGTIAMARSEETNSAAGQWYFNLRDNPHLDTHKGGYTVFGKVISGTNLLNLFIPPPGSNGIYRINLQNVIPTLPVLNPSPSYDDLIYIDISLRREVGLRISQGRTGRTITWNSVAKYSNIVEFATNFPPAWQVLTNLPGTGAPISVTDPSSDRARNYRVKLQL